MTVLYRVSEIHPIDVIVAPSLILPTFGENMTHACCTLVLSGIEKSSAAVVSHAIPLLYVQPRSDSGLILSSEGNCYQIDTLTTNETVIDHNMCSLAYAYILHDKLHLHCMSKS